MVEGLLYRMSIALAYRHQSISAATTNIQHSTYIQWTLSFIFRAYGALFALST